jgi:hypothetical protein
MHARHKNAIVEMPASSRLAGISARACLTNADEVMNTALGKKFERRLAKAR